MAIVAMLMMQTAARMAATTSSRVATSYTARARRRSTSYEPPVPRITPREIQAATHIERIRESASAETVTPPVDPNTYWGPAVMLGVGIVLAVFIGLLLH